MGPRAPTVSAARALSIGAPALVVRKGVSSWPAKKKESSIELIEVKVFFSSFFSSFEIEMEGKGRDLRPGGRGRRGRGSQYDGGGVTLFEVVEKKKNYLGKSEDLFPFPSKKQKITLGRMT